MVRRSSRRYNAHVLLALGAATAVPLCVDSVKTSCCYLTYSLPRNTYTEEVNRVARMVVGEEGA